MEVKKGNKLMRNQYTKEKYVVHMKFLKKPLNHRLIFKKEHRIIKFVQKAYLKPYTDINTKLRTEAKNSFQKDFLDNGEL